MLRFVIFVCRPNYSGAGGPHVTVANRVLDETEKGQDSRCCWTAGCMIVSGAYDMLNQFTLSLVN